jgi:hypothetical protein
VACGDACCETDNCCYPRARRLRCRRNRGGYSVGCCDTGCCGNTCVPAGPVGDVIAPVEAGADAPPPPAEGPMGYFPKSGDESAKTASAPMNLSNLFTLAN